MLKEKIFSRNIFTEDVGDGEGLNPSPALYNSTMIFNLISYLIFCDNLFIRFLFMYNNKLL